MSFVAVSEITIVSFLLPRLSSGVICLHIWTVIIGGYDQNLLLEVQLNSVDALFGAVLEDQLRTEVQTSRGSSRGPAHLC
jgi:hypothetical protein